MTSSDVLVNEVLHSETCKENVEVTDISELDRTAHFFRRFYLVVGPLDGLLERVGRRVR